MSSSIVYYGAVVNPVSLTEYKKLPRCLLAIGSDGNIDWMAEDVEGSMIQETMVQHGYIDVEVCLLKEEEFIMPGLIDTHTVCVFTANIVRLRTNPHNVARSSGSKYWEWSAIRAAGLAEICNFSDGI